MIRRVLPAMPLLAAAPLLLGACAPRMAIAPPVTARDCVEIAVWSNGVHTSLSVPAAILPESHPIRALAPGAEHVLVGWGDAAFYQANDAGFWLGLRALIPPSPGAVHLIGSDVPPETWFSGTEAPRFGVTLAGAAGLARFLDDAIARGADGAPLVLGPGHAGEGSVFLAATEGFHAFNVCNRWTARALGAAGVEVAVGPGWRADALTAQVRDLPLCPASDEPVADAEPPGLAAGRGRGARARPLKTEGQPDRSCAAAGCPTRANPA